MALSGYVPLTLGFAKGCVIFPMNFAFIHSFSALWLLWEISSVLEILRLTSCNWYLFIKIIGWSGGWARMGFSSRRSKDLPGETKSAEPKGSHPFLGGSPGSFDAPGMQETSSPHPNVLHCTDQSWLLLLRFFKFYRLPFLRPGSHLSASITGVNIDVLLKEV